MFRLLCLAVILLTASCAARESSSTDNHHRIPQPTCAVIEYGGQIRNLCCLDGRCAFER